jgi:lipid A 3-O-deacylase
VIWKDATVRNSLVLNLGVVGPWSLAEETQRLVHEARNIEFPKGWDNQLSNELGVVAVYERTIRWPRHERRIGLDWECLPHVGFAVGNFATYANAGGELRAGLNLPDDFGTPPIGPEAATPTPVEGAERAARLRKFDFGIYVFGRADGRVVVRNIFLDGNTFADSHSVEKRWLVADLSAGVGINYRNTKLTYALVYRTEEFKNQQEGQVFGSIALSVAF